LPTTSASRSVGWGGGGESMAASEKRSPSSDGKRQDVRNVSPARGLEDLPGGGPRSTPAGPRAHTSLKIRGRDLQMARRGLFKYAHAFFAAGESPQKLQPEVRRAARTRTLPRILIGGRARDGEARLLCIAHRWPARPRYAYSWKSSASRKTGSAMMPGT